MYIKKNMSVPALNTIPLIYISKMSGATYVKGSVLLHCRLWKKAPKADGMPFVGIDNIALGEKTKFIRWKVHGDWVQQVRSPRLFE